MSTDTGSDQSVASMPCNGVAVPSSGATVRCLCADMKTSDKQDSRCHVSQEILKQVAPSLGRPRKQ